MSESNDKYCAYCTPEANVKYLVDKPREHAYIDVKARTIYTWIQTSYDGYGKGMSIPIDKCPMCGNKLLEMLGE